MARPCWWAWRTRSCAALPPDEARGARRAPSNGSPPFHFKQKQPLALAPHAQAAIKHKAKKPAPLPDTIAPQLATRASDPPPDAADWLWELKFDGYRLLARIDGGRARLFTRNGLDWTARMPELRNAVMTGMKKRRAELKNAIG